MTAVSPSMSVEAFALHLAQLDETWNPRTTLLNAELEKVERGSFRWMKTWIARCFLHCCLWCFPSRDPWKRYRAVHVALRLQNRISYYCAEANKGTVSRQEGKAFLALRTRVDSLFGKLMSKIEHSTRCSPRKRKESLRALQGIRDEALNELEPLCAQATLGLKQERFLDTQLQAYDAVIRKWATSLLPFSAERAEEGARPVPGGVLSFAKLQEVIEDIQLVNKRNSALRRQNPFHPFFYRVELYVHDLNLLQSYLIALFQIYIGPLAPLLKAKEENALAKIRELTFDTQFQTLCITSLMELTRLAMDYHILVLRQPIQIPSPYLLIVEEDTPEENHFHYMRDQMDILSSDITDNPTFVGTLPGKEKERCHPFTPALNGSFWRHYYRNHYVQIFDQSKKVYTSAAFEVIAAMLQPGGVYIGELPLGKRHEPIPAYLPLRHIFTGKSKNPAFKNMFIAVKREINGHYPSLKMLEQPSQKR